MNTVTKTILDTAEHIIDFNYDLYREELGKGEIAQAIHRKSTTMGQIEGLKSLVTRLSVQNQITDREHKRLKEGLHKLWRIALNFH